LVTSLQPVVVVILGHDTDRFGLVLGRAVTLRVGLVAAPQPEWWSEQGAPVVWPHEKQACDIQAAP
jgi:hypothetical protein